MIDALAAVALMLPSEDVQPQTEPIATVVAAPSLQDLYAGKAKIRPGMVGPAVEVMQKYLNGVGKASPVNGVYDEATEKAYKSWQSKFGYWPTGNITASQSLFLKSLYGNGKLPKMCKQGRVICVDKSQLTLRVMDDGKEVKVTDVRFGSSETPTRDGKFSVYAKTRYLVSDLSGTPMPYALFFSGGQAVHYSPGFHRDGYNGSSLGCVNVGSKKIAKWIFRNNPVGTTVYIYRSGR